MTLHLNHMPNATPCIPREHSRHNFYESAYQTECEADFLKRMNMKTYLTVEINLTLNDWALTLHMVVDGDQSTSLASPQLLCTKQGITEGTNIGGWWLSINKNNLGSITHLWTSRSPRRLVICHVRPLSGSKPGWEISSPCFLTSLMYLKKKYWNYFPRKQNQRDKLRKQGGSAYASALKCWTPRSSSQINM
jgi:hypothetical protein